MTADRRADRFPIDDDPRRGGPTLGDERSTLLELLRAQRLTLELKCSGLDAEAMARRAVPPSTLSLLGLVRHMAQVECIWFRQRMSGLDVPCTYSTPEAPDLDFDGAVADDAAVAEAWATWRTEVAFADRVVADAPDLDVQGHIPGEGPISLRWPLVHMVEEYARHNGHADLLRERIDGAVGM